LKIKITIEGEFEFDDDSYPSDWTDEKRLDYERQNIVEDPTHGWSLIYDKATVTVEQVK